MRERYIIVGNERFERFEGERRAPKRGERMSSSLELNGGVCLSCVKCFFFPDLCRLSLWCELREVRFGRDMVVSV